VRKSEGKRAIERHRRKWEDNIKMDLEEREWSNMGWADLVHDRNRWRTVVNKVMNLRVP
jgi:hypothetical protein